MGEKTVKSDSIWERGVRVAPVLKAEVYSYLSVLTSL